MEFPGLGEHCSHSTCNRLDFLPMKCDACLKNYCNDHFRYNNHGCDGETRRDVQVPTCPLCEAPVPGKRGEAPDIAVSAHIDNDCQADPAKERRNKVFANRCRYKGCKGKEMVPLVCQDCSLNFCFRHRHGADHKCEGRMNAIRKRSEEAALTRLKIKESNKKTTPIIASRAVNGSNFAEIQGTMSEDEALAHALALSMQDELSNAASSSSNRQNPALNRAQANRQRVGGEQNNAKCTVS